MAITAGNERAGFWLLVGAGVVWYSTLGPELHKGAGHRAPILLVGLFLLFVIVPIEHERQSGRPMAKVASTAAPAKKRSDFGPMDALVECDIAIERASHNASQVEIPHKRPIDTGDAYGFIWRKEDGLKMPNGFGALMDAVVICRVSKATKQVQLLEINGEVVIQR